MLAMAAGEARATISFVGSAAQTATAGGTQVGVSTQGDDDATLTIAVPGGTAVGDVMIAQIATDDSTATLPTPSGWTKFADDVMAGNGGNGTRQAIYYKVVATAADATGNVTWNHGSNIDSAGAIFTYRGLDTSNPIDAFSGNSAVGGTTSLVATGIDTTADGEVLLAFYAVNADNRNFTAPAGFNERYEETDADGEMEIMGADGVQASAGATGDKTATLSGNVTRWVAHLVALRAAPMALTIAIPGNTAVGDVMVAQVAVRDSTAVLPTPTDWTKIGGDAMAGDASSGVRQAVYYRVAAAADLSAGSVTWPLPGVTSAAGAILSYRGVDAAAPVDASSSNSGTANTTSIVATGVTTTVDGAWLVGLYAVSGSRAFTPPAGFAERYEQPNGTVLEVSGADAEQAAAGASGNKTATINANVTRWSAHLVALRPAPLTCFSDAFTGANDASPGPNWIVSSSSGSFGNPRIFNNRLRLTDATGNVATMATLQRLFPGAGNRIEVEFEHFADGGSGADGIAIVLSDASVTPNPGSYGGSLGYAQRDDGTAGFAGGWLGVGIDEYGNFSAATEGRVGGPGLTIDSVSIRGSGSGLTGYAYHTGTGTLNPQVDNNGAASPPHRYRIIVDHSNGVNAWVSVERDTGAGYVTLIAPYDAKSQSGQANVPTTWMLSYTGSTGGSTNIHEIDTLRICATSQSPVSADHFLIAHSGTAVNCQAENVTFSAHDAAHAAYTLGSGTSVSLSTSTGHGDWSLVSGAGTLTNSGNGAATYVSGAESSFVLALKNTYPETVNIDVVAGTATENSGSSAAGHDPDLTFHPSGFRFTDGTNPISIGTQIAGKASNVAPGAQNLFLQAIRTDTSTGACVGVFADNTTVNVGMASQCVNPTTCIAGQQVSITNNSITTAIAANPNSGVSTYTDVPLRFGTNSQAPFTLNYPDAGSIRLYARYTIPLGDGSGSPNTMAGGSNAFVVRPFGMAFRGANTGTAVQHGTDEASSLLAAAGDDFTMTVAAYRWAAGQDANSDGVPDAGVDITGNGLTPNFRWDAAVAASANLPGVANGNITLGHADASRDSSIRQAEWSGGAATFATWRYSEVGNVLLTATAGDYISAGVTVPGNSGWDGSAGHVGRFRPKHFALDTTAGFEATLANRAALLPCVSTFSYMGEAMRLGFRLLAQNAQNELTQNYTGAYAKFGAGDPAAFVFGARAGSTDLTPRIAAAYPGAAPAWSNGTLHVPIAAPLHVSIGRHPVAGTLDGPYTAVQLGIAPADAEGVAMAVLNLDVDNDTNNDRTAVAGTTEVRYGRLALQNAFGSEMVALPMPLRSQYYAAASGFVTDAQDNCTAVALSGLTLTNALGDSVTADNPINVKGTNATQASVNVSFTSGDAGLSFTAPGAGGDGYVNVNADTGTPVWLKFDWDGNGLTAETGPFGRATFGIYRGSPRHIYLRERY